MPAFLAACLLPSLLLARRGLAHRESAELGVAVIADDLCAAAGDPSGSTCGVSLLQRRAERHSAEERSVLEGGSAVGGVRERASEVRSSRRGDSRQEQQQGAASPAAAEPTPTQQELKTLAAVISRLWTIDEPYRLQPGKGYKLNHQGRAALADGKIDASPKPLFQFVDEQQLKAEPCTVAFINLLDNFQRETDKAESVTAQTQGEVRTFVLELMKTPHMRYIFQVLVAWGSVKPDFNGFSRKVEQIWFTEYSLSSRGARVSSGFEHVFVGEEKTDKRSHRPEVIGLHNWIQYWREEKAGRIDYLGYVGALTVADDRLVSVRFAWADDDPERETKSVSTMLVGSSVPFELAMLTCAFLGFGGDAKVPGLYFGGIGPVQLTAYAWKAPEGQVVRTAYLEG